MQRFRTCFLFATAVLLLAACGPGPKPAVKAPLVDARTSALLAEQKLTGKVVLVEFGTVGCPLSDSCLGVMTAWHNAGTIPGLSFLRLEAVADQGAYDSYYNGRNVPFPVVRDPKSEIGAALGTTVFPSFALIDKFGRVRYRGSLPTLDELVPWVKELNEQAADAGPDAPLFDTVATASAELLNSTRLPDLAGVVKALSDYRGAAGALLAFIDTRCPFSAKAAQELPAVAAGLRTHGIATLVVNGGDPEPDVRKAYGASIGGVPVVYDTSRKTMQCWNVQFVPTVLLLDAQGNTLYRGSPVWSKVAAATERSLGLTAGAVLLEATGTSGG